jgi:hypothetical protein
MKYLVLTGVLFLGACTSFSDHFDRSPCACNYESVNHGPYDVAMLR